jgi:hypothetical protein
MVVEERRAYTHQMSGGVGVTLVGQRHATCEILDDGLLLVARTSVREQDRSGLQGSGSRVGRGLLIRGLHALMMP